jgi:threonine/homoserine/homoserine lactone efflux protein
VVTPVFPPEILAAYLVACVIVVLAPGPDNILALSRGLSQGPLAASLSSTGAGAGIMVHTLAATFGLSIVLQSSESAFWLVKLAGAAYLIWLGIKAIRSRSLISFSPADRLPLGRVFSTGLLSNVLNPKPGLFVLAFLPQFVSANRGPVAIQMLVYGAIFAVMTAIVFSILGASASRLATWLSRRPRVVLSLYIGAGLTFLAAGFSVLALRAKA